MSGISDEEAREIMDAAVVIRKDVGEMLTGKPTASVFIAIGMLLGDVGQTADDITTICNEIQRSALGHRMLLDKLALAKRTIQ